MNQNIVFAVLAQMKSVFAEESPAPEVLHSLEKTKSSQG